MSNFAITGKRPDAGDIRTDASAFSGVLSATDTDVQKALETIDAIEVGGGLHADLTDLATSGHAAGIISVDAAAFSGILDTDDTTVQKALATIDNYTPPVAGGDTYVMKTANETFSEVATQTDITDLVFSYAANSVYLVTVRLYLYNSGAANTVYSPRLITSQNCDIRTAQMNGLRGAGQTAVPAVYHNPLDSTTIPHATNQAINSGGVMGYTSFECIIHTLTAGNLKAQCSQTAATTFDVLKGSHIQYRKLA